MLAVSKANVPLACVSASSLFSFIHFSSLKISKPFLSLTEQVRTGNDSVAPADSTFFVVVTTTCGAPVERVHS